MKGSVRGCKEICLWFVPDRAKVTKLLSERRCASRRRHSTEATWNRDVGAAASEASRSGARRNGTRAVKDPRSRSRRDGSYRSRGYVFSVVRIGERRDLDRDPWRSEPATLLLGGDDDEGRRLRSSRKCAGSMIHIGDDARLRSRIARR
jgi:hypothetical protein